LVFECELSVLGQLFADLVETKGASSEVPLKIRSSKPCMDTGGRWQL